jgi:hypothetical protein
MTNPIGDDDNWKEQLAFVSGYILVFGFTVLKLWPLAAGFQTGMNITLLTVNLPNKGVNTPLWVFWYLTAALGMALTAIATAIGHILARGLWLAFFSGSNLNPVMAGISSLLDRFRRIMYDAAFYLLIYAGLLIVIGVLIMISAGLEGTLMSTFSLSLIAAGWISRGLVIVILFVSMILAFLKWFPRLIEQITRNEAQRLASGMAVFSVTGFVFSFMWFLAIQTCYTAEMNLGTRVYERCRNDLIEVDLALGGSTSAVNLVQLKLADARGTLINNLSPQDLGEGRYLSIVQSHDLAPGRYQVTLDYPHSSLNSSFPFLRTRIAAQRWFVVIP